MKFDAEEKRTGISEFRERMVSVALSLAGLGMLVAVMLGFRFAGPIHQLAATSDRIREGDLSAREPVKREDEIGLLAITFNDMADALEKLLTDKRARATQLALLETVVDELTVEGEKPSVRAAKTVLKVVRAAESLG